MKTISGAVFDASDALIIVLARLALLHFRSWLSLNSLYRRVGPYSAPNGWTPGKTWEESRGKVTSRQGGHFWEIQMRVPWAQAVSEPLGKGSLRHSWWEGHPEPQTMFPSPPVILPTRVISSTDYMCGGFDNQKLKISYGFSSSQNDPSPKLRDWEPEHAKPQSGWRDVCFSNDLLILCNPQ